VTTASTRQTQAERREGTRARILDAAVDCLIELGHAQTTTLVVQERAGVSRGALLHHFPSRGELLAASVDHLFALQLAGTDQATLRGGSRIEGAVRRLLASFTSSLAIASQELWTAARTDAELRAALARHERDLNLQIRQMCADLFGPDLVAHPMYDTTLRVLVQSMRGAAATRGLHPDASARADIARWVDVATRLLA
jgi:AcrR family transcriptional regulator